MRRGLGNPEGDGSSRCHLGLLETRRVEALTKIRQTLVLDLRLRRCGIAGLAVAGRLVMKMVQRAVACPPKASRSRLGQIIAAQRQLRAGGWTASSRQDTANDLLAMFFARHSPNWGGSAEYDSGKSRFHAAEHWLNPYWKPIGGGCHLDCKMDDLIRAARFQINTVETGYVTGPKPWTFIYRGSATK
jgi:hypothetical protein